LFIVEDYAFNVYGLYILTAVQFFLGYLGLVYTSGYMKNICKRKRKSGLKRKRKDSDEMSDY